MLCLYSELRDGKVGLFYKLTKGGTCTELMSLTTLNNNKTLECYIIKTLCVALKILEVHYEGT